MLAGELDYKGVAYHFFSQQILCCKSVFTSIKLFHVPIIVYSFLSVLGEDETNLVICSKKEMCMFLGFLGF